MELTSIVLLFTLQRLFTCMHTFNCWTVFWVSWGFLLYIYATQLCIFYILNSSTVTTRLCFTIWSRTICFCGTSNWVTSQKAACYKRTSIPMLRRCPESQWLSWRWSSLKTTQWIRHLLGYYDLGFNSWLVIIYINLHVNQVIGKDRHNVAVWMTTSYHIHVHHVMYHFIQVTWLLVAASACRCWQDLVGLLQTT